jgi:hypothetical protein
MNPVLVVEHLSKEYRLGTIDNVSLYKDIESWVANKLKKPALWVKINLGMKKYKKISKRAFAVPAHFGLGYLNR